jgi:hypothetical protein
MYEIHERECYYALHRDGELKKFDDKLKLGAWLYKIDGRGWYSRDRRDWWWDFIKHRSTLKKIGHNFNDTYYDWADKEGHVTTKFKVQYVVYDSYFVVVDKKELFEALDNYENRPYNRCRRRGRQRVEFRKDPVPFTGRGKWKFGCWYKTGIDCMQEKKAAEAAQQMGIRVRGRRTKNYLPNSWDDLQRGDCRIRRSWKKQKKRKQWM